jgi:hypothetical protein
MNTENKRPLTVGMLRRFFATLPDEGSDDLPFGVALEVEDGDGGMRACAVFEPALVHCKKDTGIPCLPHDEGAELTVVVGTF